jgi:hypothetical protein
MVHGSHSNENGQLCSKNAFDISFMLDDDLGFHWRRPASNGKFAIGGRLSPRVRSGTDPRPRTHLLPPSLPRAESNEPNLD